MGHRSRWILIGVSAIALFAGFFIFVEATKLQEKGNTNVPVVTKTPPPDTDFDHAPKMTFEPSGNYFRFDQLAEGYRAPGEYTHRLDGEKYGFDSLSFIITETQPNGGPNLHVHEFEEAHVLLEGTAKYRIGDKTFTAEAPYVVKVPAGVPHTFINAGTKPFQLVAVFASKRLGSKRLGPNPLLQPASKK